MTANNPYAAPESTDAPQMSVNEYADSLFTHQGRIGRMRYFVYGSVVTLAVMAVLAAAALVLFLVGGLLSLIGLPVEVLSGIGILIGVVLYIAAIVQLFRWVLLRRLHDLSLSGWMALLMLIPLVGSIFALYVLFAPSKQEENQWGTPPGENPQWVKVLFWIFIGLTVLSVVVQFLFIGLAVSMGM